MSTMLAVLIYLLAMGLPIYLLYHFHPLTWYWHVLAVTAAIGVGFVPIPPQMQTSSWDLLFGSVFLALMVWGVGGLMLYHQHARHGHHEKHA
jgi:hypothetical protein